MFRGLLSSRLIQVGLVFFVVVVSGSLLYSWQTRRATVAEFTRADVVPHETRSEQDTVDTSTVDFEQTGTSLEADDSQMPDDMDVSPIDETSEVLDIADAFLPDDMVSEEEVTEDVPVSPFGFGSYPEVPDGYPKNIMPSWTWPEEKRQNYGSARLKDFELMGRVLIKLWNQGDRNFVGVIRDDQNGKVYPTYPNTAYVTWRFVKDENGKPLYRYASNMTAAPGFPRIRHKDFFTGNIPTNVKFIEWESAGYNPYQFLNLNRR